MAVALPINQWDSWEVARTKINNSFQALSTQFQNSIPYIQNWYWYVNWESTWVPVSSWVPALRVNNGVLQWKIAGSSMEWANLLKLDDLRPGESWPIYWANITDVETVLDNDRWVTMLVIHLDDWTSRTVDLFKWTDIYNPNPLQPQQGSVQNVTRTFFAKSTDTANIQNRTAVMINPDSMEANGDTYTPIAWDTVFVYFATDCKVDAPTLNIGGTWQKNIQCRNYPRTTWSSQASRKYYYHFHIWAWTWVEFKYLWWVWYTNHISEVVDIYETEAPRQITDAVRELKRTRMDVTEEELTQIKAQGLYDPYIYYHIIDS